MDWNWVERMYTGYQQGEYTQEEWKEVAMRALDDIMNEHKDVLTRLKDDTIVPKWREE